MARPDLRPAFGRPGRRHRAGLCLAAACAVLGPWAAVAARAQEAAPDPAADQAESDGLEAKVSLPTDRFKERQLDRARRLIADQRWSDAAALLDEMLAGDRDFFFHPAQGQATWRSVKTEATGLVGALPPAGRAAYDLQFRARAERLLEEAIAAGDAAGVVAVARRWFHTPAGRRATIIAALDSLDAAQPLAAAAWLDRLATGNGGEFEPTLSVMRAVAWWQAGDRRAALAALEQARRRGGTAVRVGGREVSLAGSTDDLSAWLASITTGAGAAGERSGAEWWMARGDAARNARVDASRPLLVPRYRVPLTRHPDEARLLEKSRRAAADRDAPMLPAATPLAIGGTLVSHSPLGLLAVDFTTGKRIWLHGSARPEAAPGADEAGAPDSAGDDAAGLERVFTDATSGVVASNGRLVYAVEPARRDPGGPAPAARGAAAAGEGNTLVAYDLAARGGIAWRRPAGAESALHLGAPLAIGDQLFVLVEERGEIRLDVLGAADGGLKWSQPLAELDEEQQADRPETAARRCSGLSPAFADGVLVCPTGAGTVIAVDLATRTLLWAYTYPVAAPDAAGRGPRGVLGGIARRVIVNGVPIGETAPAATGWRDVCPVIAAGRVLLSPGEADALHCLDLRSGAVRWTVPRGEAMYVAGAVDGRVIVVGSRTVTALALDTGAVAWPKPLALGPATVSGRGILSPRRLFLPLDAPEVVEIDLDNGGIVARSPARGGVIPGNLVAYRGEVISLGVDFLDVFHQVDPLERRIETAAREQAVDPGMLLWRGQLDLDAGRIAEGLAAIAAARRADPTRVPGEVLADALLYGMRRDFAAASGLWTAVVDAGGPLPRSKPLQCVAIDNHLATGRLSDAWQAWQTLSDMPPAKAGDDDWLIEDTAAPRLDVSEPRWLNCRLGDLVAQAPAAIRNEIDRTLAAAVERARSAVADGQSSDSLARLAILLAGQPAGSTARRLFVEAIDARLAAGDREAGRALELRRDFAVLGEMRAGAAGERTTAEAARVAPAPGPDAWPLGRVTMQRTGRRKSDDAQRFSRTIPIPLDARSQPAVPGLQVGCDIQAQALVLTDGFGRRIGEPVAFDPGRGGGLNPLFQPLQAEATALGPLLVVRSGGAFAAFDVRPASRTPVERLWLTADAGQAAELPGFGIQFDRSSRIRRLGHTPLGMRISEPDLPAGTLPSRGMLLVADGVVISRDQGLELRDPATGTVAWRRTRLPAAGDLVGDDEFLCICPRDGQDASVVATATGRLVRTATLPAHHLRVVTSGRRMVAIVPGNAGQTVALEWVDVAEPERRKLGEFSAAARAAQAGPGFVAVLEPEGVLTVIDVERGEVRFRTTLPEMPAGLEHLHVVPWRDRLLVIAGRREMPQEQAQLDKLVQVMPLPQMTPGDDAAGQVFTGAIWAVSRSTGEPLWPVPATVVRHALHRQQPADLPVLAFARHLQSRRDGNARLGLLLLDKRTGHAVYADDRTSVQPHMLSGCELSGDPEHHAVTLGRVGGDAADVRLEFTGAPMAPRPPYQAAQRPAGGGDLFSELESWLQRALTIPLPF